MGVETLLRYQIGAMMLKSDAVNLGVTESLIHHVAEYFYHKRAAKLSGVYLIKKIKPEIVPSLYPNLDRDGHEIVTRYLSQGSVVLAFFQGNGSLDMWNEITMLKGKRMNDWDLGELNGALGLKDGMRCIMPVPSTREVYQPVMERIRRKRTDANERFTTDEFETYCQNLVHSPDDLAEFQGLLGLLNKKQRKEVLCQK